MEIRFIDMFCGIGGFRYGLEKSNGQQQKDSKARGCGDSSQSQVAEPNQSQKRGNYFGCVWSNDNDRYACQIYRKHFGEGEGLYPSQCGLYEGDIRAVNVDGIPEHDLLCAGFPCQSFSIAGKRKGFEDTRGTLFFEICRVIRAKRPDYLLLENVKGLLSHDDGSTFERIIGTLDELGYDCQWQVLNSKDYGVPQNRERVFIVGHFRGKPRPKVFPIGEENPISCYEIGTITAIKGAEHSRRCYSVNGLSPTISQMGGGNTEKKFLLPTQDIAIANALDVDGYLRIGARPRDESGKPQLLPIGYRRIRRLTPLECERLQGFPDGWTKGISDTQRYKCLGNAVTVNVIEAIGRQFLEGLENGG